MQGVSCLRSSVTELLNFKHSCLISTYLDLCKHSCEIFFTGTSAGPKKTHLRSNFKQYFKLFPLFLSPNSGVIGKVAAVWGILPFRIITCRNFHCRGSREISGGSVGLYEYGTTLNVEGGGYWGWLSIVLGRIAGDIG